jgi:hypothetical protein
MLAGWKQLWHDGWQHRAGLLLTGTRNANLTIMLNFNAD